ncbi:MAG: hypothetical protein V4608_14280 [Bacteroidota bacterium]
MSENKNKLVELRTFTTWLGDDGICYTVVKPNVEIVLEDAMANSAAIKAISSGMVFPLLVNLKAIKTISKEARDHFSMRNRTPGVTAIAMLINSPGSRIIGNFFLGINKPAVPTKLFNDKNKAIEWLKQFANNQ